ncbi:hypothetical protein N2152v2_010989 [Parachlorella kessleri]
MGWLNKSSSVKKKPSQQQQQQPLRKPFPTYHPDKAEVGPSPAARGALRPAAAPVPLASPQATRGVSRSLPAPKDTPTSSSPRAVRPERPKHGSSQSTQPDSWQTPIGQAEAEEDPVFLYHHPEAAAAPVERGDSLLIWPSQRHLANGGQKEAESASSEQEDGQGQAGRQQWVALEGKAQLKGDHTKGKATAEYSPYTGRRVQGGLAADGTMESTTAADRVAVTGTQPATTHPGSRPGSAGDGPEDSTADRQTPQAPSMQEGSPEASAGGISPGLGPSEDSPGLASSSIWLGDTAVVAAASESDSAEEQLELQEPRWALDVQEVSYDDPEKLPAVSASVNDIAREGEVAATGCDTRPADLPYPKAAAVDSEVLAERDVDFGKFPGIMAAGKSQAGGEEGGGEQEQGSVQAAAAAVPTSLSTEVAGKALANHSPPAVDPLQSRGECTTAIKALHEEGHAAEEEGHEEPVELLSMVPSNGTVDIFVAADPSASTEGKAPNSSPAAVAEEVSQVLAVDDPLAVALAAPTADHEGDPLPTAEGGGVETACDGIGDKEERLRPPGHMEQGAAAGKPVTHPAVQGAAVTARGAPNGGRTDAAQGPEVLAELDAQRACHAEQMRVEARARQELEEMLIRIEKHFKAEQAARRQADDLVRSLTEERDQALARLAEVQLGSRQQQQQREQLVLQQEAADGLRAAAQARPLEEQKAVLENHHARLHDLRAVLLGELQKAQAEVHRAEEEVLGAEERVHAAAVAAARLAERREELAATSLRLGQLGLRLQQEPGQEGSLPAYYPSQAGSAAPLRRSGLNETWGPAGGQEWGGRAEKLPQLGAGKGVAWLAESMDMTAAMPQAQQGGVLPPLHAIAGAGALHGMVSPNGYPADSLSILASSPEQQLLLQPPQQRPQQMPSQGANPYPGGSPSTKSGLGSRSQQHRSPPARAPALSPNRGGPPGQKQRLSRGAVDPKADRSCEAARDAARVAYMASKWRQGAAA